MRFRPGDRVILTRVSNMEGTGFVLLDPGARCSGTVVSCYQHPPRGDYTYSVSWDHLSLEMHYAEGELEPEPIVVTIARLSREIDSSLLGCRMVLAVKTTARRIPHEQEARH